VCENLVYPPICNRGDPDGDLGHESSGDRITAEKFLDPTGMAVLTAVAADDAEEPNSR
jgi:hypothetical protein